MLQIIKRKNMKRITLIFIISLLFININNLSAGNKDRSGTAGAAELLINPWARSSGIGFAGLSTSRGLEALSGNVGGLAFTKRTEIIASKTNWLKGADISINNVAFAQHVGESGVFALSLFSMSFNEMQVRTTDVPDGGIGTFSPVFFNLGVSYAKSFSNSVFVGGTIKIVSQSISNLSTQGVALDGGIQYVTGDNENIKMGISIKNVGPRMKFSGDGLTFRGYVPGADNAMTLSHRSDEFELPSLLNMGASYDFLFGEVANQANDKTENTDKKKSKKMKSEPMHRVTLSGNFTANSFSNDQMAAGIEYCFNANLARFMVRGGYTYEEDMNDVAKRVNWYSGPSAGATLEVPFNKVNNSTFGIDYSYRATHSFDGIHTVGLRINL